MTYQGANAIDPAFCRGRKKLWYAMFSLSFVGAIFFLVAGSVGLAGRVVTKNSGVITAESNRRNLVKKKKLRRLANSISGNKAVKDELSPASRAYNWLLVGKHNSEGNLKERYCLAVLYFSFTGRRKRKLIAISENYNGTLDIPQNDNSTLDIPENYNDAGTLDIPEITNGDTDIPEYNSRAINISENNDADPAPFVSQLPTMSVTQLREGLGVSSLKKSNWLKRKISHCEWDGITCDENKRVTKIYLPGLGLKGTLPQRKEFAQFTYLEMLFLGENKIRGGLPASLFQVTSLKQLYLQNNRLSGTVPSELGNLVNLVGIYMGDNKFVGPIPPSISKLQELKFFSMLRNDLSGLIPATPMELAQLDLGWNNLEGSLPPSLIPDKNLHFLYLNNNNFTGTIPSEWNHESSRSLEEFHINDNSLIGTVPNIFGQNHAHTINLQNNNFELIDPNVCERNAVLSWLGALVELGVNCGECPCLEDRNMCNEKKCYP
eukprot:scaffold35341_cov52-Attheya_sp.AAC.3